MPEKNPEFHDKWKAQLNVQAILEKEERNHLLWKGV